MVDYLKELLKKNNVSVRAFAQQVDISRPFIQNVFAGRKKPSRKLLDTTLALDWLTDDEKIRLQNLFFASDAHTDISVIDTFISLSSTFDDFCKPGTVSADSDSIAKRLASHGTALRLNGQQDIVDACVFAVRSALASSEPKLYTNYPFSFTSLDNALYSLLAGRDYSVPLDFYRLVDIPGNVNGTGLKTLFNILRWGSIQLRSEMRAHNNLSDDISLPSYVLVTGDTVVLLDPMFSSGIISRTPEAVSYYKECIDRLRTHYYSADRLYWDEVDLMRYNCRETVLKYSLSGCVSLGFFADDEIYRKVRRQDIPMVEYLQASVIENYNYHGLPGGLSLFMTASSVEQFMKDGNFRVISDKYIKNFPPEVRIEIAENLCKSLDDVCLDVRFIREDVFGVSKNLIVEVYDNAMCFAYVFPDDGLSGKAHPYSYAVYVPFDSLIGVSTFCEDLFDYLSAGSVSYAKENTRRIVRDIINKAKFAEEQ